MGRSFKRKTPKVSEDALQKAIEAVRAGGSLRTSARLFGVPRTTLRRRSQPTAVVKKHSKQVDIVLAVCLCCFI